MTVRGQWLVVLGIITLLAGGAFTAMHFLGDELTAIGVGSSAPAFSAKTLPRGETPALTKTLGSYKGEVVLLNVWATWCGPCRDEMPSIEALHKGYGPKGLKVVAVSVDAPGDTQKIEDFVREFGLTFEVLHDIDGKIRQEYRTTGVPETFVIDREGKIRRRSWVENWNSESNQRFIASLLAEPRAE